MSDLAATEIHTETVVSKAKGWAEALVRRAEQLEDAGKDNAIRTAARWANVTYSAVWQLVYRPPREVGATTFLRLRAAHRKHIESVEAKVAENLIALKSLPSTPARDRLVAGMEKYLGDLAGTPQGRTAHETFETID